VWGGTLAARTFPQRRGALPMEVPDLPFDALVLVLASAGHARLLTVSRDWRDARSGGPCASSVVGTAAGGARWLRVLVRARAVAWIASRRSRPCDYVFCPRSSPSLALVKAERYKCARCRAAYYCNAQCQERAWCVHKYACGA
jgi:hypothetical protein